MKKKSVRNKDFKIIPEAKLVQGRMQEKKVYQDLKAGIKGKYKHLIAEATDYYEASLWKMGHDYNEITANAYCDEKDEWDEKVGIEVCAAKMEMKNHRKLARMYNRIANDLQEACLIAQSYCVRHEAKAMAIENDLVEYHGRIPM